MSIEMLDELEDRIRQASERIRALKEQNGVLTEKVAQLEKQLKDATNNPEAMAWTEERKQVRQRLEGLTQNLDKLLRGA